MADAEIDAKNVKMDPHPPSNAEKDPDDWVTGDEPATGAQKSYLDTLARQAGEEISADLTKAQASEQIERLQEKTGRGQGSSSCPVRAQRCSVLRSGGADLRQLGRRQGEHHGDATSTRNRC